MPRIKSAIKRVTVAERNRRRNIAYKSAVKTAIKKVVQGSASDMAALEAALNGAYSLIDRAVLKGMLHKNTAARYKARIAKVVNKAKVA